MANFFNSMLLVILALISLQLWNIVQPFSIDDASNKSVSNQTTPSRTHRALANHERSAWDNVAVHFPLLKLDEQPSRLKKATFDENLRQVSLRNSSYKDIARAQSGEDIWLYENLFFGMKDGLILESGALDGMKFSTSYMFEKFAGWSAVHVEVDPHNYHALIHNRPQSINVHSALCSSPQKLHFVYSQFPESATGGIYEFMGRRFVKKWHPQLHADPSLIDQFPAINCLRAADLFAMLGITHIDVWVLDVEGAEESVLLGTDFNVVRIEAVAMECDQKDQEKNNRKIAILESNNFHCSWHMRSCMCVQKDYIARNTL